jgi:hypothetical protein
MSKKSRKAPRRKTLKGRAIAAQRKQQTDEFMGVIAGLDAIDRQWMAGGMAVFAEHGMPVSCSAASRRSRVSARSGVQVRTVCAAIANWPSVSVGAFVGQSRDDEELTAVGRLNDRAFEDAIDYSRHRKGIGRTRPGCGPLGWPPRAMG